MAEEKEAQPEEKKEEGERREWKEKWPIDVKSHGEALLNVLGVFARPTSPAAP